MTQSTSDGRDLGPDVEKEGSAPDAKALQIMDVARDSFLELGYAGTSMDLVASRARVSKTTLYSRFPSKEDLFVATIANECEMRGLHFKPADFTGLSVEETLVTMGQRITDVIWSEQALRLYQSVMGERQRFPEVASLFFQVGPARTLQAVVAVFEDLSDKGSILIDDPLFAAQQFFGMLHGGDHCAIELGQLPPPDDQQREQFCRRAVRMFVNGIRPALSNDS